MNKKILSLTIMAALASTTPVSSGMQSLMRIQALANGDAELLIYGPIGESWYSESVTAKSVVQQLQDIKAGTIQVRINSEGGSVQDGLSIYNALKRHAAKIIVTVDGIAASIASLIAMAGDEVNMPDNTLMMVHAPWAYAGGNAAAMREAADILDTYAASMATSYVAKTGKNVDEIEALLKDGKDHWYTAAQAVAFGFADKATDENAEAIADEETATAALLAYTNAIAKAPMHAAAKLRGRIQACLTQSIFASASGALQQSILDNLEDVTMKQHYGQIMANAAGASAANSPASPAALPVANPAAPVDPAAAATTAAFAAIQARNTAIATVFGGMRHMQGVTELEQTCLADVSMSSDQANGHLLAHLAASAGPLNASRVEAGTDEVERIRSAGVNMLLARSGVLTGAEAAAARQGNPFLNLTLAGMAEQSLIRANINTRDLTREQICQRALAQTTSDFPLLLENTLNKMLLAGYAAAAFTWNRFCATGTLSDYRPHGRYQLSSFSDLKEVNEAGEYETGTLGDASKESIQGKRKGRILQITPEVLVNDDLGGMQRIAAVLGQAAARTIEKDVYALLALNAGLGPLMRDGLTLFHATHGNIAAVAAAPSMASFDATAVALGSQKDPGGNDFLDIAAAVWLGPLSLRGTAMSINGSEYDPDVANKLQKPNIVKNMFADVVGSPRLSGTPWYAFANPALEPVIEVAFLDGVQVPTLEQETNFRTDGLSWKAVHKYGVGAIGYKGAIRNAGA